MNIDRLDLFHTVCPGYFEREYIRALDPENIYEEQVLDLHTFSPEDLAIPCPAQITFGIYQGDRAVLHEAVRRVDEGWVQWYGENSPPVFCAMDGEKIASFCLLDDFGSYQGLRIGAPGCVGTVPEYRRMGIGLRMVQLATQELKDMGYDLGYIHYTAVGHWYARLGYETVVKWNRQGIVEGT